eukprot:7790581-Alexandrium_andersonii.AAC.1
MCIRDRLCSTRLALANSRFGLGAVRSPARPLPAAGGRCALPDSLRPQRLAASSGSATGTAAAAS